MGFEMTNQTTTQDNWVSDRRLWLTADKSTAVEDGDPRGRFLLCGTVGAKLPKAQAEALGLLKTPEPEKEPEVKEDPKPADKAMKKPATKARKTTKRRKRT